MSLLDVVPGGAEAARAEGRIGGVASGVVSANRDPDGLGRVRVRMPWLGPDAESDWIKLATLHAGPDRGTLWLPEVGDEVLLAFEHGDVNHPVVLGALWNAKGRPPEAKAGVAVLRSRTGHAVVISDEAGKGRVEISTSGGHTITLSDAGSPGTVTVADSSGRNLLTLDAATGTVTLKAATKLSLQAPQIELDATGPLTLRGATVEMS